MKRNHAGLLAIALILGVSGAIAANIHARPKKVDQAYNWTSTSNAPLHPNSVLLNATIPQATNYFGCTGLRDACADGVASGVPDAHIFIN